MWAGLFVGAESRLLDANDVAVRIDLHEVTRANGAGIGHGHVAVGAVAHADAQAVARVRVPAVGADAIAGVAATHRASHRGERLALAATDLVAQHATSD